MRLTRILLPTLLLVASAALSQQTASFTPPQQSNALPDAPSSVQFAQKPSESEPSSSAAPDPDFTMYPAGYQQQGPKSDKPDSSEAPLETRQPKRILGIMPNFRSVSGGIKPPTPGWKYNFNIATHQSFDYSSFIFVFLNSISAEGLNEHPKLGKGVNGLYEYSWRGLIDKTDGTFVSAFFLSSLLHEDTRFYALGHGHPIATRELYVISRQAVAKTYGGHATPNIANLGGKVLTQVISRQYYPAGTSDFGVLAEKFGYAVMRDVIFTTIREFYPDIAAHYIRKHREKLAMQQATQKP